MRTICLFVSWICKILIYMQVRKHGDSWVMVKCSGVFVVGQCSEVCLEQCCRCLRDAHILLSSQAIQTLQFSVSTMQHYNLKYHMVISKESSSRLNKELYWHVNMFLIKKFPFPNQIGTDWDANDTRCWKECGEHVLLHNAARNVN